MRLLCICLKTNHSKAYTNLAGSTNPLACFFFPTSFPVSLLFMLSSLPHFCHTCSYTDLNDFLYWIFNFSFIEYLQQYSEHYRTIALASRRFLSKSLWRIILLERFQSRSIWPSSDRVKKMAAVARGGIPSASDLDSMYVGELRALCLKHKLPVSGRRGTIRKRLDEFFCSNMERNSDMENPLIFSEVSEVSESNTVTRNNSLFTDAQISQIKSLVSSIIQESIQEVASNAAQAAIRAMNTEPTLGPQVSCGGGSRVSPSRSNGEPTTHERQSRRFV